MTTGRSRRRVSSASGNPRHKRMRQGGANGEDAECIPGSSAAVSSEAASLGSAAATPQFDSDVAWEGSSSAHAESNAWTPPPVGDPAEPVDSNAPEPIYIVDSDSGSEFTEIAVVEPVERRRDRDDMPPLCVKRSSSGRAGPSRPPASRGPTEPDVAGPTIPSARTRPSGASIVLDLPMVDDDDEGTPPPPSPGPSTQHSGQHSHHHHHSQHRVRRPSSRPSSSPSSQSASQHPGATVTPQGAQHPENPRAGPSSGEVRPSSVPEQVRSVLADMLPSDTSFGIRPNRPREERPPLPWPEFERQLRMRIPNLPSGVFARPLNQPERSNGSDFAEQVALGFRPPDAAASAAARRGQRRDGPVSSGPRVPNRTPVPDSSTGGGHSAGDEDSTRGERGDGGERGNGRFAGNTPGSGRAAGQREPAHIRERVQMLERARASLRAAGIPDFESSLPSTLTGDRVADRIRDHIQLTRRVLAASGLVAEHDRDYSFSRFSSDRVRMDDLDAEIDDDNVTSNRNVDNGRNDHNGRNNLNDLYNPNDRVDLNDRDTDNADAEVHNDDNLATAWDNVDPALIQEISRMAGVSIVNGRPVLDPPQSLLSLIDTYMETEANRPDFLAGSAAPRNLRERMAEFIPEPRPAAESRDDHARSRNPPFSAEELARRERRSASRRSAVESGRDPTHQAASEIASILARGVGEGGAPTGHALYEALRTVRHAHMEAQRAAARHNHPYAPGDPILHPGAEPSAGAFDEVRMEIRPDTGERRHMVGTSAEVDEIDAPAGTFFWSASTTPEGEPMTTEHIRMSTDSSSYSTSTPTISRIVFYNPNSPLDGFSVVAPGLPTAGQPLQGFNRGLGNPDDNNDNDDNDDSDNSWDPRGPRDPEDAQNPPGAQNSQDQEEDPGDSQESSGNDNSTVQGVPRFSSSEGRNVIRDAVAQVRQNQPEFGGPGPERPRNVRYASTVSLLASIGGSLHERVRDHLRTRFAGGPFVQFESSAPSNDGGTAEQPPPRRFPNINFPALRRRSGAVANGRASGTFTDLEQDQQVALLAQVLLTASAMTASHLVGESFEGGRLFRGDLSGRNVDPTLETFTQFLDRLGSQRSNGELARSMFGSGNSNFFRFFTFPRNGDGRIPILLIGVRASEPTTASSDAEDDEEDEEDDEELPDAPPSRDEPRANRNREGFRRIYNMLRGHDTRGDIPPSTPPRAEANESGARASAFAASAPASSTGLQLPSSPLRPSGQTENPPHTPVRPQPGQAVPHTPEGSGTPHTPPRRRRNNHTRPDIPNTDEHTPHSSDDQPPRRRRRRTRTQFWVTFVIGGTYLPSHPVFSAPSLLTNNPTYEDLLLVEQLLSGDKPPVATEEDLERAGGEFRVEETSMLIEERCPVCLVDYEIGDLCRRLRCNHEFHQLCVDQWLTKSHNSCPMCRQEAIPPQ